MAKKTKTPMLGDDVKATPINKTLKDRKAKADKERKNLERRVKKRGSVVGEAQ